jgi:cytochrome c biogenesis protein
MTTPSGPTVRQSVALVWRTLRSMRTALILLLILAAAAVIGSLLPQIPNSPERVGRYLDDHGAWGTFLFRAGFFDVYGSWWFALITTLLFISLAACLFPRTRALVRALRQRPVQARELDGFRHHAELRVGADPADVAAGAVRYLRRRRFRVSRQGEGVAAEKGVLREVGSLLFHGAFFLLLLGVIVGKGTGFTGRAVVTEGETWVDARLNYAGQIRTGRYFGGGHTGIGIELLDFEDSYRRSGLPIDFVSRVRFLDRDGRPAGVEEVRVNHPVSRGGLRIFQEGFGWAPVVTASIDGAPLWSSPIEMTRDQAPEGVPATAMPWRGAIKLTAPEPDVMVTLELWPDYRAFANLQLTGRPTPMLVRFDPYIRYSVYVGRIADPAPSTIDTTGLERVARGDLRAAGTSRTDVPEAGALTLSFPELRQYSVLLISRDVGIPLVLAAAILVLVGLIPALYVSRRKVWIRAEPAPGGALVKIGGFALQRKDAFEEEFDRIVRAIGERNGDGAGGGRRTPEGSRPPQEPHPEEVGTS